MRFDAPRSASRALVLVLALALAAGCVSGDGAPGAATRPPGNSTATTPPPTAGIAPPAAPNATGAAVPLVLFLDAGPSLSLVAPAEGTVPVTLNFLDPEFQTQSSTIPPWSLASALPGGVIVESATFDVFYSSETPQASYRSAIGLGSFAMFLGEEGRNAILAQYQGPDALPPGEVVHATGELELPPGGLVFEAGASPSALIGFTYTQNDGAPIDVHVGGADPSRITLMARAYAPAFGAVAAQSFDGVVDAENGGPFEFPIEVGPDAERILASLAGDATLTLDVDVAILAPSGDAIAASFGPTPFETAKAYGPNVAAAGPGTYVVRVTVSGDNTGGRAGGTFALDVETTARAAST